ncbi:MAG TPA: carboxylating nicotinate-nucleotide diphosphorylase, partial [Bacteroidales bacterium]|nr:carboxylating nicotinate-nucleotide diphosphorylase [Bacteroidales bacterium]
MMIFDSSTDKLIALAIAEDLGTGDITTNSVIPEESKISGQFIAREDGVVCGLGVLMRVFAIIDPLVVILPIVKDGQRVVSGQVLAQISGPARSILSGERVSLNFLQHLSGIATKTARIVESVEGTGVRILDTRKTIPGLRWLEKYAVRTGGGTNHRMNLSDGLLIKNNHIKAAGSITKAIEQARLNAPPTLKTEVEVENLEQVQEALTAGADIILLDNMNLDTMRQAVELINGNAVTEASGNMEQKNLADVAKTGVDMISIGGLTHSVKALDISLRVL